MDAAMMVMAPSAAARMTSSVVDSVKVELEMDGSCVTLMIEVTPALRGERDGRLDDRLVVVACRDGENAYKIPMLIATRTPNFSFLFMVRAQMIFHGRTARTMSMAPE